MSINTRVEAATASMESSAMETAADTVRIGRFANEPTGYTATGGEYVPSLREKLSVWEAEKNAVITNTSGRGRMLRHEAWLSGVIWAAVGGGVSGYDDFGLATSTVDAGIAANPTSSANLHIDTGFLPGRHDMALFEISGAAFYTSEILHSQIFGYWFGTLIYSQTPSSGVLLPLLYVGSNGNMHLRLHLPSAYYCGLRVDLIRFDGSGQVPVAPLSTRVTATTIGAI